MGCDIHLAVEHYDSLKQCWERCEGYVPNRWYDPEAGEDDPPEDKEPLARESWYHDRNYDVFAMLADVRNGRGFAGVRTGSGFVPINEPRGVPDDVSAEWAENVTRWDCDGHSHSWQTARELTAYDWYGQRTTHAVWVKDKASKWGEADNLFGGGGVPPHLREKFADGGLADFLKDWAIRYDGDLPHWAVGGGIPLNPDPADSWTTFDVSVPYWKSATNFLALVVARMVHHAVTDHDGNLDHVRIVYFFDN